VLAAEGLREGVHELRDPRVISADQRAHRVDLAPRPVSTEGRVSEILLTPKSVRVHSSEYRSPLYLTPQSVLCTTSPAFNSVEME